MTIQNHPKTNKLQWKFKNFFFIFLWILNESQFQSQRHKRYTKKAQHEDEIGNKTIWL